MALYSKHQIKATVATDSNSYITKTFERNDISQEVARTDLAVQFGGTFTLAASNSRTFSVAPADTDIAVIRQIYIESNGAVTVSLLDATGTANEITTLVLAGPAGAGSCKLFAETQSFATAASDTLVFLAGSAACQITFALWGDSASDTTP